METYLGAQVKETENTSVSEIILFRFHLEENPYV